MNYRYSIIGATILTALTAALVPLASWASNARYVTDRAEITLRTGITNQHRIVKVLSSGVQLELLEEDAANGYSHVRTNDGADGWVLSRYLLTEPTARDQLAAAQQTATELRNEMAAMKEQLNSASGTHKNLEKEQQSLDSQNRRLQDELTKIRQTAANALSLDSENQALKKRVFALERDAQVMQQQTEALKDRSQRDWFVAGSGVVIAGMILGLVLPKIRFRRKSSWGSL